MSRPADLTVRVGQMPEPGLLRPAIEAVLQERPWPPGAEAQVAEAVRDAVTRATTERRGGGER